MKNGTTAVPAPSLSEAKTVIYRRLSLSWSTAFFFLLLVLSAAAQSSLPRSAPEKQGVSPQGILDFLDAAAKSKNEFHSIVILRHGKVVAEGWWNPYRSDLKHTMYSVSKSFTSTAVGFAVSEKRLSVEDNVLSFFPEHAPETVSPFLANLKVKHLLTMSVGQDPDPSPTIPGLAEPWVKAFLATPILNEPGSRFLYNSMATYMLSAIVTKVTGQKVIDYLRPRLFEPLGITDIDWETDPQGINTGGWGFRIRTEDMAKFGQLLLQKGVWNKRQVLPAAWVEEATTKKILQSPEVPDDQRQNSDWLQGYCYQFWRCRHNGFRADGAFGQYIIVLPEQDAVIAITSETGDMQDILNLVYTHLLPAMGEGRLPKNKAARTALQEKLGTLALPVPSAGTDSPLAGTISGKTYRLAANDRNLERISFQFKDRQGEVSFGYANGAFTIPLKTGKWAFSETNRRGPYLVARAKNNLEGLPPFKVAAAYRWLDNNTLELTLRYIESPHTERLTCSFQGDAVKVATAISFAPAMNLPVLEGSME